MSVSDEEKALQAAYSLPIETSLMIVQLGQERLKALQASGAALDARTTQVAAIQLAAAAFAGGLVAAKEISVVTAFIGLLACAAFVIGSAVAFKGIQACKQQVSGLDPSWWHDATNIPEFSDQDGRAWAAKVTEEMISYARLVDEKRAEYLNLSLGHGLAGGVLVCASACARFWSF